MMTRMASATVVMIAVLASSQFLPYIRAETGTASSLLKTEYRAAFFGNDETGNTKRLNELAVDGWEYIGPLGNGMVAFQRRAVVAQRVRIVGTWELVARQDKGTVEFLAEGKIKLDGNTLQFTSLFEDAKQLIELKGNLSALSYELPQEGTFALKTDFGKLGLAPDDLKKFHAKAGPGGGGIPVGPSSAFAKFTVNETELTITRLGKTQSFKRAK